MYKQVIIIPKKIKKIKIAMQLYIYLSLIIIIILNFLHSIAYNLVFTHGQRQDSDDSCA